MPLTRLFNPRGVAFVGAVPDRERYAGRTVEYCVGSGFAGAVYPVNPKYDSVFGLPCYKSLEDIPGPIDVVVILVGPSRIPDLLDQCRRLGVGYAIAYGDLVDPGPEREARLAAIRAQIDVGGPRIVGPVCVGVMVPPNKLAMTMSSGTLAGPPHVGGIGLITQSGGIFASVLDRGYAFHSGFSALVSSGAEFDLNICDYVEHMLGDDATRCISVYVEKLVDPARLFRLAALARAKDKPILMFKAGRSEVGARVALTHSGAIASNDAICQAAFRRHGIVEVNDLDDLHMTARLLCDARVDPAKGIAGASQSGGYCTVLADAAARVGVPMATLSEATIARIHAETPIPRINNPIDSGSGPPGNNAPNTRAALIACQDDPGVGATVYAETMYMYQREGHPCQIDVVRHGRKPHIVAWHAGVATEPVIRSLREAGVIVYDNVVTAMSALGALYTYGRLSQGTLPELPPPVPVGAPLPHARGLVADDATKAILRAHGVPLVPEIVAGAEEAAVAAARRIGFPVVVKGIGPAVGHKTEHGLVRLGIKDAKGVEAAVAAMSAGGMCTAFLVQPMLTDAIEFAIGIQSDLALGPAVLLGFGGIYIEALGAPVIEMAPINAATAEAMIRAVDRKDILGGYRTGKRRDRAALADALVAAGRLAWNLRDRIESLDLNPVIVCERGAFAVDAVLAVRAATGEVP
jgi:acyl-CoA synthetase (NDP forming)